jgi:hypothetical protein
MKTLSGWTIFVPPYGSSLMPLTSVSAMGKCATQVISGKVWLNWEIRPQWTISSSELFKSATTNIWCLWTTPEDWLRWQTLELKSGLQKQWQLNPLATWMLWPIMQSGFLSKGAMETFYKPYRLTSTLSTFISFAVWLWNEWEGHRPRNANMHTTPHSA